MYINPLIQLLQRKQVCICHKCWTNFKLKCPHLMLTKEHKKQPVCVRSPTQMCEESLLFCLQCRQAAVLDYNGTIVPPMWLWSNERGREIYTRIMLILKQLLQELISLWLDQRAYNRNWRATPILFLEQIHWLLAQNYSTSWLVDKTSTSPHCVHTELQQLCHKLNALPVTVKDHRW